MKKIKLSTNHPLIPWALQENKKIECSLIESIETDRYKINDSDCFIFGDIERHCFANTDKEVEMLYETLIQKPTLFFGGWESYGDGGWSNTPISTLYPGTFISSGSNKNLTGYLTVKNKFFKKTDIESSPIVSGVHILSNISGEIVVELNTKSHSLPALIKYKKEDVRRLLYTISLLPSGGRDLYFWNQFPLMIEECVSWLTSVNLNRAKKTKNIISKVRRLYNVKVSEVELFKNLYVFRDYISKSGSSLEIYWSFIFCREISVKSRNWGFAYDLSNNAIKNSFDNKRQLPMLKAESYRYQGMVWLEKSNLHQAAKYFKLTAKEYSNSISVESDPMKGFYSFYCGISELFLGLSFLDSQRNFEVRKHLSNSFRYLSETRSDSHGFTNLIKGIPQAVLVVIDTCEMKRKIKPIRDIQSFLSILSKTRFAHNKILELSEATGVIKQIFSKEFFRILNSLIWDIDTIDRVQLKDILKDIDRLFQNGQLRHYELNILYNLIQFVSYAYPSTRFKLAQDITDYFSFFSAIITLLGFFNIVTIDTIEISLIGSVATMIGISIGIFLRYQSRKRNIFSFKNLN